jgi:hypothetical protein
MMKKKSLKMEEIKEKGEMNLGALQTGNKSQPRPSHLRHIPKMFTSNSKITNTTSVDELVTETSMSVLSTKKQAFKSDRALSKFMKKTARMDNMVMYKHLFFNFKKKKQQIEEEALRKDEEEILRLTTNNESGSYL